MLTRCEQRWAKKILAILLSVLLISLNALVVWAEETAPGTLLTGNDVSVQIFSLDREIYDADMVETGIGMGIRVRFLPDHQPSLSNRKFTLQLQEELAFVADAEETVFRDDDDYPSGVYSIDKDNGWLTFTFDEEWLKEHSSDVEAEFYFAFTLSDSVDPGIETVPFHFPGQTADSPQSIQVVYPVDVQKEVSLAKTMDVAFTSGSNIAYITNAAEETTHFTITFSVAKPYSSLIIKDTYDNGALEFGDIKSVTYNGEELPLTPEVVSAFKDHEKRVADENCESDTDHNEVELDFVKDIYQKIYPEATEIPAGTYSITYNAPVETQHHNGATGTAAEIIADNDHAGQLIDLTKNTVELYSEDDAFLGRDSATRQHIAVREGGGGYGPSGSGFFYRGRKSLLTEDDTVTQENPYLHYEGAFNVRRGQNNDPFDPATEYIIIEDQLSSSVEGDMLHYVVDGAHPFTFYYYDGVGNRVNFTQNQYTLEFYDSMGDLVNGNGNGATSYRLKITDVNAIAPRYNSGHYTNYQDIVVLDYWAKIDTSDGLIPGTYNNSLAAYSNRYGSPSTRATTKYTVRHPDITKKTESAKRTAEGRWILSYSIEMKEHFMPGANYILEDTNDKGVILPDTIRVNGAEIDSSILETENDGHTFRLNLAGYVTSPDEVLLITYDMEVQNIDIGEKEVAVNTAKLLQEGFEVATASNSYTVDMENVLTKIGKTNSEEGQRRSRNYTITLNPNAYDLILESDEIVLEDTVTGNPDFRNFKVMDGDTDITASCKAVKTDTCYEFTVPDAKALVITYTVVFDDETLAENENVVSNSVAIKGYPSTGRTDETDFSVAERMALAKGVSTSFKVTKVDGDTKELLAGAVFGLYMYENGTFVKVGEQTTNPDGELIFITYEAGEHIGKNLMKNTLHYIIELLAPDNYEKSDEKIYFIIKGNEENFEAARKLAEELGVSFTTETETTVENTHGKGDLRIVKDAPEGAFADGQTFTVTVILSDNTIAGQYGDAVFEEGVATLEIAVGETKVISELPSGLEYSVSEEVSEGEWTATYVNETGKIGVSEATEVTVTNTPPEAPKSDEEEKKEPTPEPKPEEPTPKPLTPVKPAEKTVRTAPKTGDENRVLFWGLLLVSSIAVAIASARRRRQRE